MADNNESQTRRNVSSQYCDPIKMFLDQDPEISLSNDKDLVKEYVISRVVTDKDYSCNAGAVQLWKKTDAEIEPLVVDGKKFVKHGFSCSISGTWGHTERILMRDILHELITKTDQDFYERNPKLKFRMTEDLTEDLRQVTEEAVKYRKYLESRNIIIKMMSDRPACRLYSADGGACEGFMEAICPRGSWYGYVTKNYSYAKKDSPETQVKNGYTDLVICLIEHKSYIPDLNRFSLTINAIREVQLKTQAMTTTAVQCTTEQPGSSGNPTNQGAVPISVNKPDDEEAIQEEPSPKKSRLEN